MSRRLWLPLLGLLGAGIGYLLLTLLSPEPATIAGPQPSVLPSVTMAVLAEQVEQPLETATLGGPTLSVFDTAANPTPEGDATPESDTSETPAPTPLVLPGYFVEIVQGDTLWDIAVRVNISMQAIIDANPTLDPNLLLPGDTLLIPDPASPTTEIAPGTGPTPELAAYVSTDGLALNLRASPVEGNNVITTLEPATPLNVVGRTQNGDWLQVVTPAGGRGWVMLQWVTLRTGLSSIPISEPGGGPTDAAALPTLAPTDEAGTSPGPTTPSPDGPTVTPLPQSAGGPPSDYPYISNVTPNARAIFLRGQTLGNRPDVFSRVGDSITVAPPFLTPIGLGDYDLRDYEYLAPVVDFYSASIARDANSFANTSLAAKGGWSAWTVLNPAAADSYYCLDGESPLVCEYRLIRPSVALIMLGTNDVTATPPEAYEDWMRETIQLSIDLGVIPVLSTIPEFQREGGPARVTLLNSIIADLAREYDVPLWDYHAALVGLPNDGLSSDGVHPSWEPDPASSDFTPENLINGMTVRNLTALQTLDAVWREAIRS